MDGARGNWFRRPPLLEQLRALGVREDLVQAAGRTAFGRQSHVEIAGLAAVLDDDEVVVQLLEGRHAKAIGLLVATTRRVVFAAKSTHRRPVLIIDRSDLLSVEGRTYRGLGVLTLTATIGDVVVDQILGTQAESFADTLTMVASSAGQRREGDPLEELAALRALHRAGAIDDAEYGIRKGQLFDQI